MFQLIIEFKKVCESVRREGLYNIVIECGTPMKLVRLIKMCLNDTYSRVCVEKQLSELFPVKNSVKQNVVYRHCSVTLIKNTPLVVFR